MPIFPEYRPLYKIAQILLILKYASRGKKSSLIRLHLFNWTLKNTNRREKLSDSASSGELLLPAWGVEPALNLGLQFALAEGLIKRVSVSYILHEKGIDFLAKISADELLKEDSQYLVSLGSKITEGMINQAVSKWEQS